jgi:hypothetical protein
VAGLAELQPWVERWHGLLAGAGVRSASHPYQGFGGRRRVGERMSL